MSSHEEAGDKSPLVTCIVIGAGHRGEIYTSYALGYPDKLKVVGVADPKESARRKMQKKHNIAEDRVFDNWEKMVALDKFADFAIITTPDPFHRDPAVACAEAGYNILLEKPIATTEQGCRDIIEAVKRNKIIFSVCYVLRYSPAMQKIKQLIDNGAVGQVVNIQHLEQVGYWHFAHSFVRGNWCKEETSSFSLLGKCCHDIDLLLWWMSNSKWTKVSSFGSLYHFKKENQPPGATSRCLDCPVEKDCCYSAKRLYLDFVKSGETQWPVSVLCDAPSIENVTDALRNGPYGRCVYDSDNDVCDNQVVNVSFEGGQTASLSMIAYTRDVCERMVRVFGTKGEISLNNRGEVLVTDFLTQQTSWADTKTEDLVIPTLLSGHSRSDFFLISNFVKAIATKDPSLLTSTPDDILAGHLLTFEAERSRRESKVISLDNH